MKPRWLGIGAASVLAFAGALQALSANAPAADAAASPKASVRQGGPDVVTLNFVNADIDGVAKVVSEVTGKNFLIDPRVKGTVNIVSARPMSRDLVYQVFLSAIRLQGFTAIEEGGVVKILPEAEARMHHSPTLGPQDKLRASGDSIQTQVFQLRHQPAAQIVPVLRPLIPTNNTIAAYPSNNTLVVTDYASNLRRIARIIESVDQPDDSDPVIIQLKHASALDVAQTVSRLLAEPTQATDPSQRFVVTADARTNSVLARAGDKSRTMRVRQLVAMLDSATSAGGNIHVIHLKNAVAVKLAEVLRAIYSGDSGPAAAPGRPAPSLVGQPTVTIPAAPAGSTPGIIQADAATNSIIITAPDAVYNNLRAVVEKLDVRRAQVYVEALIAELTADKTAEFGIQWQSLGGLGRSGTQAFGGTNFGNASQNLLGISQDPGQIGRGLNVGIINGTVTIPGVGEILNLHFLARALEADTNANILSTPTLLTLDNEEAKIVIGQNIPIVTGSYAVSAGATSPTPFQTIERKDVGLTLRIKPQISEGGAIRLQLFQEVSSISESSLVLQGVITNKRSVESTVLVEDGQIVAIGGLIQDTVQDGVEKVPGLGDLPLIGNFFRYSTRKRNKANLMVFLRPVLLRNGNSAEAITRDRYDYIIGEQLKSKPPESGVLPNIEPPTLPPLQDAPAAGATDPATPK